MGIGAIPQQLLRKLAAKLPQGFSVCELGNQMYATKPKKKRLGSWERAPAHEFYLKLGCTAYVTIDGNGKATILADLNCPLPSPGEFDLVTDFGTSEHVFDQAQCWRTKHQLTKVGGYMAGEHPYIGYPSHGFYSMHPCLFHDLARANSYTIEFLDEPRMPRGLLVRYILRRNNGEPFRVPNQGKYRKRLKV